MSNIIQIDRSVPFNPETFIGPGWSILNQDERSLVLTEIDLDKVILKITLKKKVEPITGKENFSRLKKKNYILLDAGIFKTFWDNRNLIPERFKKKTNGNTTFLFFGGTTIINPIGEHFSLYLCWDTSKGTSKWLWHHNWLNHEWFFNYLSLVL